MYGEQLAEYAFFIVDGTLPPWVFVMLQYFETDFTFSRKPAMCCTRRGNGLQRENTAQVTKFNKLFQLLKSIFIKHDVFSIKSLC